MRVRQLVRTAVIGAMAPVCVGAVAAQQIPQPLPGPAASGADYSHLSLVTPAPGGDWTFLYDLCNRRTGNMSFAWEDVGFGVDLANPLAGGVCATYQSMP